MADRGSGDDEPEFMNWVSWIGHENHVARSGNGLRHVGETFLGPERRNDLGIRVQGHAEALFVIGCLRAPQTRNAARGRIAIRPWFGDRLDQFLDDMSRGWHIRIAHAEVNNIITARTRLCLEAIHTFKYIRRQPFYPVKFLHLFTR